MRGGEKDAAMRDERRERSSRKIEAGVERDRV